MVRHGNCPFCRETFLPVDNPSLEGVAILKRLSRERKKRESITYFCVEQGLVSISDQNLEAGRALVANNVTKEELATMRAQDDLESRASSTDSEQYRLELANVVESTVVLARSDSVDIVIDISGTLLRDAEEP